jgi:hypothetical protein
MHLRAASSFGSSQDGLELTAHAADLPELFIDQQG